MLEGIKIESNTGRLGAISAKNFEDLKSQLGFETATIVSLVIDDNLYDVICDDEALLYEPVPLISTVMLFESGYQQRLHGNVAILKANEEGQLISLDANDLILIRESCFTALAPSGHVAVLFKQ